MNTQSKIVGLSALKKKIRQHRRQGKKIAFTNGCFDILHLGHVTYLEKAKKSDYILIIGLNSDRSIRHIKVKGRPMIPQDQRGRVLAALACVDYVIVFDEDTPENLIRHIQPDILLKGADWKGKPVAGAEVVKAKGGKVEFVKFVSGMSTTRIIETILRKCGKSR